MRYREDEAESGVLLRPDTILVMRQALHQIHDLGRGGEREDRGVVGSTHKV